MKKIFILLFSITATKSLGQTYSFNYSYRSQNQECRDGGHGWKMDILSNIITQLGESTSGSQYPPNFFYRKYTIKSNPSKINIEIIAYG